jgi:cobaltochelatase CobN
MQTVMTQGGLYEEMEELERYLAEYEQARLTEKGRAHSLEHLILDLLEKTNLKQEIRLTDDRPFEEVVKATHEALSRIRNTQIQDGMHIFGELPEGESRAAFINSVMRYDAGRDVSLRKLICKSMGLELRQLLEDQGVVHPDFRMSHGQLLEEIDTLSKLVIGEVLGSANSGLRGRFVEILGERLRADILDDELELIRNQVLDLDFRIGASKEIEALLYGFDGGYIPAGPSGLVTRGRDDVLPTGRNFFSLDPQRVPTKAAFQVGERLAQSVIEKHQREEGKYPENVAIFWMCTDIMWSDGEGMAQIFSLLGVRPTWLSNGRVNEFEVIPLEVLGRRGWT